MASSVESGTIRILELLDIDRFYHELKEDAKDRKLVRMAAAGVKNYNNGHIIDF